MTDNIVGISRAARDRLFARLRRPPSPHTVAGSLPVLFFGDLPSARIATVGINPSDREYLDPSGSELEGAERRFETLRSLGAASREALDAEQCVRAIETMRAYYQSGKPVYGWFRPMARVLEATGLSYDRGEVTHLDLVQEATRPTWSRLRREHGSEAASLVSLDGAFLRWELQTFDLSMVLCNGRTVFDGVLHLLGGTVLASGTLARTRWWVARVDDGSRLVALVGWSIPLLRPTGLGAAGERELGELLSDSARSLVGVDWSPSRRAL